MKQRDILLASMNAEYRELSKDSRNVENLLQSYGINYIVWDKDKNPEWDLSFIRGLKKVFSYSNFEIYKIQ